MEIQRPVVKLMVLHSQHDKTRESPAGKSKWRISLSRSSSSSQTNNSPSKSEIPEEFLCPISGSLMADPVIVSSGHSYERACVIASKTLGFTPNSPPDFSTVIPNLALKSAILSWCDRRCFPPPKPLDIAAAEKLVFALMEKTQRPNRKVSISEKELIQAIKDKPSVRLDHAATELDRRPNYFNSSSDESVASSSRTLQLATRPSCFSSPSSAEIDSLEPNPTPEEEALLMKLKSNRISEIEEALISIRRVTRIDEASRTNLCTARLISALRSLIGSRYAAVQVNVAAVLVNLSLEKSNKVKIVRSGIVPPLIDVLKCGSLELSPDFNARLGKFGLARWLEHEIEFEPDSSYDSVSSFRNHQFRVADSTRSVGPLVIYRRRVSEKKQSTLKSMCSRVVGMKNTLNKRSFFLQTTGKIVRFSVC